MGFLGTPSLARPQWQLSLWVVPKIEGTHKKVQQFLGSFF